MCTDGVSMLIFDNDAIMEKMSNPILDFVHKQVVMTLYSLHASNRLDDFRELLPTYLSKDWSECAAILRTIEHAGLITLSSDGIALTHAAAPRDSASCGCR